MSGTNEMWRDPHSTGQVVGVWDRKDQFVGLKARRGSDLVKVEQAKPGAKASGLAWLPLGEGWGAEGNGTIEQSAAGLLLTKTAAGGHVAARRYGQAIKLRADSVITMTAELSGVTSGANLRIEMSSDNFTNKSALLEHVMKGAHGEKITISFPASMATLNGGELITNTMNYAGVRLIDAAAGASVKVTGLVINAFDRPRLVIDFDDGFLSQYTETFRIMAGAGLVGNVAVIASEVGTAGHVNVEQLREMYAAGWDMMPHGYNTHAQINDEANTLADVLANRAYIERMGMDRAAEHYVFPGGVVAPFSRQVMQKAGMATARIVDENLTPTHSGVDAGEALGLWSFDISQNRGVANLLAAVDRGIAAGATVRMHGHRVVDTIADPGNELTVTDFKALCAGLRERVRGGLIDNVTMSQWWALVA